MFELIHYQKEGGADLFGQWLEGLKDRQARLSIAVRLVRLENGNFGDCKPVGEGVWEQRIDWGPGYRVYNAVQNKRVILLCNGGDKRTQGADINKAIARWKEWQTRESK